MELYKIEKDHYWTYDESKNKIYVALNGNHDDLYKGHCYVIDYVKDIPDDEYHYFIGDLEFPDVESTLIVANNQKYVDKNTIDRVREFIALQSKVK